MGVDRNPKLHFSEYIGFLQTVAKILIHKTVGDAMLTSPARLLHCTDCCGKLHFATGMQNP